MIWNMKLTERKISPMSQVLLKWRNSLWRSLARKKMVFIFLLKEEELIMLIMTSKLLRKFFISQNSEFFISQNTHIYLKITWISVKKREFIGDSIILSVAKTINRHKVIGNIAENFITCGICMPIRAKSGFGERVDTFFSPRMWHHAWCPTTVDFNNFGMVRTLATRRIRFW